MNFLSFIQDHFLHAGPVLFAALLAIGIVVERMRSLMKVYPLKDNESFMARVQDFVYRNDLAQAIALCDQNIEKPVAKVVKAALSRAHLPEDSMEQGVDIVIAQESQKIGQRTPYLATIANVATLMGLFGTILGLIQSFQAVSGADPAQKSALLSAGISTAMNATMLGLGVAIPCMVLYAFLINKSNHLQSEVEESALKTLDWVKMRYYQNTNSANTNNHVANNIRGAA